ncbi:MAG: hypothetical protein Q8P44_07255 [Dehalococcoidia bacterium]|nr:hypothetical protein [Dehalococcoidia bacterium]
MDDKLRRADVTELGAFTVRFEHLRIPLLLGFFVILYAAFGLIYLQAGQKQADYSRDIALKEEQLKRPPLITEQLRAYHQTSDTSIPRELTGEDVVSAVLAVADKSGFDVAPGTSQIVLRQQGQPRKEKVGKRDYQVLTFTITGLDSDYGQVIDFISNLYSEPGLETLAVSKVQMDTDPAAGTSAKIDFGVYILQGAPAEKK